MNLNNYRRNITVILISVIAALLVGVGIYFVMAKKSSLQKTSPGRVNNPSQTRSPSTKQALSPSKPNANSDKTANWKMYQDNKFGYRINYPSNIEIKKINPNGSELEKIGWGSVTPLYTMEIYRKVTAISLKKYIVAQLKRELGSDLDQSSVKWTPITIGGKDGLMVHYNVTANLGLPAATESWVFNKETAYVYRFNLGQGNFSTYGTILSTFRFVK